LFVYKRKRKSSVGNRIFEHHRIVSAVKRVEFVSGVVCGARGAVSVDGMK
jgi:hypothetical protein